MQNVDTLQNSLPEITLATELVKIRGSPDQRCSTFQPHVLNEWHDQIQIRVGAQLVLRYNLVH